MNRNKYFSNSIQIRAKKEAIQSRNSDIIFIVLLSFFLVVYYLKKYVILHEHQIVFSCICIYIKHNVSCNRDFFEWIWGGKLKSVYFSNEWNSFHINHKIAVFKLPQINNSYFLFAELFFRRGRPGWWMLCCCCCFSGKSFLATVGENAIFVGINN